MSLGQIDPAHRPLLRWHGWLLAGWVLLVGWLASRGLLALGLSQPWLRWPLSMLLTYGVGFLGGAWLYVRWWLARLAAGGDRPTHAADLERQAYDEDQRARRGRLQWLSDAVQLADLADLFAPLAVVAAVVVALAALVFAGLLPVAITETLGGFMAELLLEFVIGTVAFRRVLRPAAGDAHAERLVRRTWGFGLLAVLLAAVAGALVWRFAPGAVTLMQVLRA